MSFRVFPCLTRHRPLLAGLATCGAIALAACAQQGPNTPPGPGVDQGGLGNSNTPAPGTINNPPPGTTTPDATSPNGVTADPNATSGGNVGVSPNATVPAGNGNGQLTNGNDTAITPLTAIINPNINFDGVPRNDNKAVALTFDDGPDGPQGATTMVLDTLKKENLKATFFICANVGFANLETDPTAQAQLRRILADGHQVANHTYSHQNLAGLSTTEVDGQFQRLNDIYEKVIGPNAPKITLLRAPFGSPFQLDNPNTQRLASTITKHGVEVGWGMDPKDWTYDHYSKDPAVFNADVQSVIAAVKKLIDQRQWGAILLHAVHLPSATALPTIIKMLRDAGYHFVSVEDIVRAEYGANSASIMAANRAAGTAK